MADTQAPQGNVAPPAVKEVPAPKESAQAQLPLEPPPPQRLRVDDAEYEPDELVKHASTWKKAAGAAVAYKGLVERGAKAQAEYEALQTKLKSRESFEELAKEHGYDLSKLGREAFQRELEERGRYANLTPEERAELTEARKLKAEHERLLAETQKRTSEDKQRADETAAMDSKRQLIGVLGKVWDDKAPLTQAPQHPFFLEVAASSYRAQLQAGLTPDPQLVAQDVEEFVGALLGVYDSDERFDAKAWTKKHPKRADAVRQAAIDGLGLSAPGQAPSSQSQQTQKTREDEVERWVKFSGRR
jgi:hypothetical protein